MPNNKKWIKPVSSSLVALSLIGGFALSGGSVHAESVTGSAVMPSFSDVPVSHWASKHITKLKLQGIVQGNAGNYEPNSNISQQEAVTMLLRFMGKEDLVQKDEAVVFPEAFSVNDYFKPYIVLAFKEGLLDQTEEFKRAEEDSSQPWGARAASREWITKLVVKAIGKEDVADEMAASTVAFSDGNKISEGYAGYVNAAVSLKLVNGVTADSFEPQGAITRASIATLLSRAESQFPVEADGQETAVLAGKSASELELYGEEGDREVSIDSGTYFYRFDSEQLSSLDALTPNTNVEVITDASGKALYVEQLDANEQVTKISGTFDHVDEAKNKLWLWVDGDPVGVDYDSSFEVKDAGGSVIPVATLPKDSQVIVLEDTYRETPKVLSIEVQSSPVNKSGTGTVTSVDPSTFTIQVADSASGTTDKLDVSPDADIIWQGSLLQNGLNEVRIGDSVSYEVKNSLVTRITIQRTSSKTVQGELYAISSDSISYVPTGSASLEAKFMADAVTVAIEGMNAANIADLVKGDQAELTVNENDQVIAVKVLNRKVKMLNGAVIVNYDPDLKALFVKSGNDLVSVYLSDQTKIDYNGTAMSLLTAAPFLVKNRMVSLGYTDNKAITLQFVYKYSGKISSIDSTASKLTLTLADGSSYSVGYSSPSVIIYGKPSASLSDVKSGDTVTVLLNETQDKATTIQVHTPKQFTIKSVDAAGKKLELTGSDGTTTAMDASSWTLLDENGDTIALSALAAGQTGNVTFEGATPISFQRVSVTDGRITSVSADKMTIVTYGGSSVDIPFQAPYSVVKNGLTGSTASVLAVGDRVEVRKDAGGAAIITVNGGVAKTFWKVDSASNQLSVKKTSLNDTANVYTINAMTTVTQGGAAIPVSSLKDGDKIKLYLFQGVLLEVEKLS